MLEVRYELIDVDKVVPRLYVNDNLVSDKDGRVDGFNDWIYINSSSIELSRMLIDYKINEILQSTHKLTLFYPLEFWDLIEDIRITCDYKNRDRIYFDFILEWDFEEWKKPYSIMDFGKVMSEVLSQSEYENMGIKWELEDEVLSNGCYIRCTNFSNSETIKEVYDRYIPYIQDIHNKVILRLNYDTHNSMVSLFDFPEEVKTSCEQYLIYFVKFLKDIGIEAVSNLQNEAGKILFSVTPTSNNVALEKIREALDIYLQLPISFSNINYNQIPLDINTQQLVANIQHLNSQLMLSRAIIQTQEYTIGSQTKLIEHQQKLLDASILQQSQIVPDEDNKEEILEGMLSLKKYEGNGFEVDLPNVLRKIKNILNIK